MVIGFIGDHKESFGVEPICRVLSEHGCKIAPSTYYAARTRAPSKRALRDAVVLPHIERVHRSPKIGRGLYGADKVYKQLCQEAERGEHPELGHVPKCQVERLMTANGLVGKRRGGTKTRTTTPDAAAARPADLVKRNFTASKPNQLWVVDFTYVVTWAGMAFSAFVLDVYSRRIVGWRTKASMPTELPLDALEMALWTRQQAAELVAGLIHHSDAGSQYTAIRYTQRLTDAGAVASIGTVADSYDNAMAESLIGLYKSECVEHDGPWPDTDALELGTLNWVWWYNNVRLHSAIGYTTPIAYEKHYYDSLNNPQHQPVSGEPALH